MGVSLSLLILCCLGSLLALVVAALAIWAFYGRNSDS
jgi:hypothetical protein